MVYKTVYSQTHVTYARDCSHPSVRCPTGVGDDGVPSPGTPCTRSCRNPHAHPSQWPSQRRPIGAVCHRKHQQESKPTRTAHTALPAHLILYHTRLHRLLDGQPAATKLQELSATGDLLSLSCQTNDLCTSHDESSGPGRRRASTEAEVYDEGPSVLRIPAMVVIANDGGHAKEVGQGKGPTCTLHNTAYSDAVNVVLTAKRNQLGDCPSEGRWGTRTFT